MTERLRVLQVINAFSDEAPAQSAAALAKYLDRTKFDVTAVSLRAPQPSAVAALERAGLRHVSMEMAGFLDVRALVRLIRSMRQWRPDIVHSHALRADLCCGLCGKLAGVPSIVITIRNHDRDCFRTELGPVIGRLAAAASKWSTFVADAVIGVSQGVADYLVHEQHVPASKVHVVENGFDFDKLIGRSFDPAKLRADMGWHPDDLVIGTLAIMKPRKGLTYLIHAAREVLAKNPRARFFVAGQGDRGIVEAEVARLGLQTRFQFLGYHEDPLGLINAADVYALPSLFEGLPRSILEAMALAKPVVATDIGGSREVVRHEETGLLVPPGDAASLARALNRLVESPDLRSRYGAAGRQRLEQEFDARRTALAQEAMYRRLPGTAHVLGGVAGERATRASL